LRGARVGPRDSIIPGDVILAIDGRAVDGTGRLLARLDDYRPGDTVKLTVWREGKQVELSAQLESGDDG
jgi:S1-C subfamily serine protease